MARRAAEGVGRVKGGMRAGLAANRSGEMARPHAGERKTPAWTRHAVILFLVGGTLVGALLARDYGESWDERDTTVYGQQAWEAFLNGKPPAEWYKNAEYYGPFYLALVEGGTHIAQSAFGGFPRPFARHFLYFEAFLVSVVWLHKIVRRTTGPAAAALAAGLYATQPLLFGHAFINPKDMPFLALFTGSVAAGLTLIDRDESRAQARDTSGPGPKLRALAHGAWESADPKLKRWTLGLTVVGGLIAADLLVFHQFISPGLQAVLSAAYRGEAWAPIDWAFRWLAPHAKEIPLEAYVHKLVTLDRWSRFPLAGLALLPPILVARKTFRSQLEQIHALPVVGQALVGGALVGLATSVRVVGPWAGILITALWCFRRRRVPIGPLAVYWTSAALVTYLSWPYLWGAPVAHFLQSVGEMVNFEWNQPVLFAGQVMLAPDLPRYALPFFMIVQTTEPALVLAAVGVWHVVRHDILPRRKAETAMAILWLAVPMLAFLALGSVVYDNGRQYLFLLPPTFVLAGIGADFLFGLRGLGPAVRAVIALAVLTPGVVGILSLHPYEYIYYNGLVGGVSGAYRSYELDYWATSYREAMGRVNHLAGPNSWIAVSGPWELAAAWAREDLKVYRPLSEDPRAEPAPSFAILTTRSNTDLEHYPWAPVVEEVRIGGGVLSTIRAFEAKPQTDVGGAP